MECGELGRGVAEEVGKKAEATLCSTVLAGLRIWAVILMSLGGFKQEML